MAIPTPDRIFQIGELLRRGVSIEQVHAACRVDPWFLDQMSLIVEEEAVLRDADPAALTRRQWKRAKQLGFSDAQLAALWGVAEPAVRELHPSASLSRK